MDKPLYIRMSTTLEEVEGRAERRGRKGGEFRQKPLSSS